MVSSLFLKIIVITVFLITIIFAGPKKEFEIAINKNSIESYQSFIEKRDGHKLTDSAKILLEKAYFDWVKSKNNIDSYTIYLEKYPNGKFKNNVLSKIENIVYKEAKEKNTIDSYSAYLIKYPDGKAKADALSAIEIIVFKEAKDLNSEDSYLRYLSQYSNGKFKTEAYNAIEAIVFNKAQEVNSEISYSKYLEKYPKGKYKVEALDSIEVLNFKKACSLNSEDAYKEYLKKYPNGHFSTHATDSIEYIKFRYAEKINSTEIYKEFLQLYPSSIYKDKISLNLKSISEISNIKLNIDNIHIMTPKNAFSQNSHMVTVKSGEKLIIVGLKGSVLGKIDLNISPFSIVLEYEDDTENLEINSKALKMILPLNFYRQWWLFRFSDTESDREHVPLNFKSGIGFKAAFTLPKNINNVKVYFKHGSAKKFIGKKTL